MVINRSQLSNKSATANYDPRPQNIVFGNFYRALKFWLVFESWTVAVALAWGTTVKLLEVPLSALTIIYHTNNWLLRFPCFLSLSLSLSRSLYLQRIFATTVCKKRRSSSDPIGRNGFESFNSIHFQVCWLLRGGSNTAGLSFFLSLSLAFSLCNPFTFHLISFCSIRLLVYCTFDCCWGRLNGLFAKLQLWEEHKLKFYNSVLTFHCHFYVCKNLKDHTYYSNESSPTGIAPVTIQMWSPFVGKDPSSKTMISLEQTGIRKLLQRSYLDFTNKLQSYAVLNCAYSLVTSC